MLNYKIRYNNTKTNIQIPLINNIDFIGSDVVVNEDDISIDEFEDLDITKFKLSNILNLTFRFFNFTFQPSFITAGFTENEIKISNKYFRYSYILIQLYDTFDSKNQTLLHTGYIPIYLFPNNQISTISINPNIRTYEFTNIYIQKNNDIINNQTLFVKFSFFNAKTGKIILFFNQSILNNTEEKLYFKINVNKNNNTYFFVNPNIVADQYINEEYINRINDRPKKENKSPIFTTGDLFDVSGDYK